MTDGPPSDDQPDPGAPPSPPGPPPPPPGPPPPPEPTGEPTNVFPATEVLPTADPSQFPPPPPPPGYTPEPSGYPPGPQGYPPPTEAQPGYPGYPPQQPGYPPDPGYPQPQPGYPPQQAGYPPQPPGYPAQPGYPQQQPGYPPPPAPSSSGNGCLKAFLIVAGLLIVLAVVGGIVVVATGRSIVETAFKEFGSAPDNTYDVRLTTCRTSSTGTPEMSMDFVNRSGEARRFRIRAGYFDGDEQVGISRSAETVRLSDGESQELTVSGGITPPQGFTCRILDVSFNGR